MIKLMKVFNIILIFIIIISFIYFLFFYKNNIITEKIIYKYDTITYTINSTDTLIIYKEKIILDTIIKPIYIDTSKVIEDYYKLNIVSRNYIDSNLNLNITDTIYMNKLFNSKIDYKLLRPQTIIYQNKESKFNLGVGVGLDRNLKPNIMIGFYYKINFFKINYIKDKN